VIADETLYRVDGEAGRFEFTCHRVMRERSVLLDTSRQVFAPLIGKGRYRTVGFKDLAIVHGVLGSSYRDTTERINRIGCRSRFACITWRDSAQLPQACG
jgi:hypothetical protein